MNLDLALELNLFDILLILTISISCLFGIYKGFLQSTISLAGHISAFIIAFLLMPYVKPYIIKYVSNDVIAIIVSAICAYIASLLITSIITGQFLNWTRDSRGGFIDRISGLTLGFFRGIFFCLIIFFISVVFCSKTVIHAKNLRAIAENLYDDKYPDFIENSQSKPYLLNISYLLYELLPVEYQEYNFKKEDLTEFENETEE